MAYGLQLDRAKFEKYMADFSSMIDEGVNRGRIDLRTEIELRMKMLGFRIRFEQNELLAHCLTETMMED